jgi:hypothetical protein
MAIEAPEITRGEEKNGNHFPGPVRKGSLDKPFDAIVLHGQRSPIPGPALSLEGRKKFSLGPNGGMSSDQ